MEEVIKQGIEEGDSIEEIYNWLQGVLLVGFSSQVCTLLVIPLMKHALQNKALHRDIKTYSQILQELYSFTDKNNETYAEIILNTLSNLLQELYQRSFKHSSIRVASDDIDLEKLNHKEAHTIAVIITHAYSLIAQSNLNTTQLYSFSIIWNILPWIVAQSTNEDDPISRVVIDSVASLCSNSIDISNISDQSIYNLLLSLVNVLNHTGSSGATWNTLAPAISHMIQSHPSIRVTDMTGLSVLTNSLAYKLEHHPNIPVMCVVLHICCLLVSNDVREPWIAEMQLNTNAASVKEQAEVDLLREKLSLLSKKDADVLMEDAHTTIVDQSDQLDRNIKYEPIFGRIKEIVEELISLEPGDDRSSLLIAQIQLVSACTDNTSIPLLCKPYMEDIVKLFTRMLSKDPDFAENIARLFGYELPMFLSDHLHYALPYAVIFADDDDILSAISDALQMKITDVLEKGAQFIVIAILTEQDETLKLKSKKRLQNITKTRDKFHTMVINNNTSVTTRLAMGLGNPELKEKSLHALTDLKNIIKGAQYDLSDYMSSYFIAISEKISRFISEKRNASLVVHDPFALESLQEVMGLLGNRLIDHGLHLKKIFNTVNELPNMQLQALELWKSYISHLGRKSLATQINPILLALFNIMSVADESIRLSVAQVVESLVSRGFEMQPELYDTLPVLPDFQELAAVREMIAAAQDTRPLREKLENDLRNIVKGFSDFDDVQVLSSLQKLLEILETYPTCKLFIETLYSHLFHLIQKYASHKRITYLASQCLGRLGATDPSLVNMDIIDETVFVLGNFEQEDEVLDFVCDLIINHIYPTYNAVSNEDERQCIEYSIQTLVRKAGYRPVQEMMRPTFKQKVYDHWKENPKGVQEFLTPFLESSYRVILPKNQVQYPIFANTNTFEDWASTWYSIMAPCARNAARDIFEACIPIAQSNLQDVTLHLIPYLVVHLILSGTPDDGRHIIEELKSIVSVNATPNTDIRRSDMNHRALQVAVAITEYCRKWMTRVGPRDVTKKSQMRRIERFLHSIPDKLMGIAAFHAKAYAQALMHFETHIIENDDGRLNDPDILDYLRQIYIKTDDTIDLKALMDIHTNTRVLTIDEEITRFESLGSWDEAESLYKSKLSVDSSELSSYIGYMDCLKNAGNYEALLYVAHELSESRPEWEPQINAYRIDAAWRMENWHTLEKAAASPSQETIPALMGCILNYMRKGLPIHSAFTLEEARFAVIQKMTISKSQSYRKLYPQLADLQLLQELEDSQLLWDKNDPTAEMKHVATIWQNSRQRIRSRSQFKLNLLELRKAAFFGIRDNAKVKLDESKIWLDLYKVNRKMGNMPASLYALQKAELLCGKELYTEKAKWLWKSGNEAFAINLIKAHAVAEKQYHPRDALLLTDIILENPERHSKVFAKTAFSQALRGPDEKMEKGYYNVSTYYLNTYPVELPIKALIDVQVLGYVLKASAKALEYGSKYYYSSMSRLINAWLTLIKAEKESLYKPEPEIIDKLTTAIYNSFKIMGSITKTVPPYQFSLFLSRLIAYLSTNDYRTFECLERIIRTVFEAYPRNTIWYMMGALDSDSPNVSKRMKDIFDKARASNSNSQIPTIINQAMNLKNAFINLMKLPVDKSENVLNLNPSNPLHTLLKMTDLDLNMPNEACLLPNLPDHIKKDDNTFRPYTSNLPTIVKFSSKVVVMRSLQRPKKIVALGSDGQKYRFLIKKEDDLRKDARTTEFFYMINSFLRRNIHSRDSNLYIRTFAIIPMGVRWGMLEWIDNLNSLKAIVSEYWEAEGRPSVAAIAQKMNSMELSLGEEKKRFFLDKVLPACAPVFYRWFLESFPEPNQWLSSRTRYIKTVAVMSIVGYIVGLGDRHAENIMFDQTNGDVVHVDLNLLFDKGKSLPIPELVPFRLTHNMVHAMGVLGMRGLFQSTCETTLTVLLQNKEPLISVFQTLLNELEATEDASVRLNRKSSSRRTIEKALPGIEAKFDVEVKDVGKKVKELIKQAINNDNLSQMFPGWGAFV